MIQFADLKSSVYSRDLFEETPSQITIKNEDEKNKAATVDIFDKMEKKR